MKILVDENMISRRLMARLQAAGHDVIMADDAGLLSVSDARVLAWAVSSGRQVLTRDYDDLTVTPRSPATGHSAPRIS